MLEICFVGDVMLARAYADIFAQKDYKGLIDNVLPVFRGADIVFGNLECPISLRGAVGNQKLNYEVADEFGLVKEFPELSYSLKSKGVYFRAQPNVLPLLKEFGFNIMAINNNHIFDYGKEGHKDTCENLLQNNILPLGIPNSNQQELVVMKKKGVKIGFLAYHWNFTSLDTGVIFKQIDFCKQQVDFLVISFHWGIENFSYPLPSQVKLAHGLVDSGADLIIGHGPHVIQGVEEYKGKIIVYSLGNFMFDDFPEGWDKGLVFKCTVSNKQLLGHAFFSVFIDHQSLKPYLVEGEEKKRVMDKITRLSLLFHNNGDECWKKLDRVESIFKAMYVERALSAKNLLGFVFKIGKIRPVHLGLISKYITKKLQKIFRR